MVMYSHQCVLATKHYSELFNSFKKKEMKVAHPSNQINLPLSIIYFYHRVARIVKKVRNDYRKSKGFTEDQYLTVLAPGN
jgi:hypothetical protein